jgi:hypothetical protein
MQTTGSRREVVITVIPEPRKRPVDLRFGARAEVREHIAECKRQLDVLPADDSDQEPGHGEPGGLTPAELTAVLGRLDARALAQVLFYAHGFCAEAVESSFVLCQRHGGTFGPSDCDACAATRQPEPEDQAGLAAAAAINDRGDAGHGTPPTVLADPAVRLEQPCQCGHARERHFGDSHRGHCTAPGCGCPAFMAAPEPGAQPAAEQERGLLEKQAADVIAESIAAGRPVIVEDDEPQPRMNVTPCQHGNLACPLCDAEPAADASGDGGKLTAAPDHATAWPATPFLPAGLLLAAAGAPCKCGHPMRGDDGHEQPDSDDGQPGGCMAGGCGCRSWRPARAKAAGEPSLVVPLIVPGMVIPGDGEARPFPAIGAAS